MPDGGVAMLAAHARAAVVTTIAETIGDALVMGPWIRDHHTDHMAVTALVREACARHPGATLLEYAAWLDELGTECDPPRAEEGPRSRWRSAVRGV
jgi:LmbE family N-acetylglucosaminyl deacetylase